MGHHQSKGYPVVLGFRVTSLEKAAVEAAARAEDVDTSEYLRSLILPTVTNRIQAVVAGGVAAVATAEGA